jgi:hypothetical protein
LIDPRFAASPPAIDAGNRIDPSPFSEFATGRLIRDDVGAEVGIDLTSVDSANATAVEAVDEMSRMSARNCGFRSPKAVRRSGLASSEETVVEIVMTAKTAAINADRQSIFLDIPSNIIRPPNTVSAGMV